MVTKKEFEERGYYSASFFSSDSGPRGFDKPKEVRLVLRTAESASGYVAPLVALWTRGVIDAPSSAAAKERFKDVVFKASHRGVADEVRGSTDAIGATITVTESGLRSLGRFASLPSDVVVITSTLTNSLERVKSAMIAALQEEAAGFQMKAGPILITGFEEWTPEFEGALAQLDSLRSKVSVADRSAPGFWNGLRVGYAIACFLLLISVLLFGIMHEAVRNGLGITLFFALSYVVVWVVDADGQPVQKSYGLLLLAILMLAVATGIYLGEGIDAILDKKTNASVSRPGVALVAVVGTGTLLIARAALFESVSTIDALMRPPNSAVAGQMVVFAAVLGLLSTVAIARYAKAIVGAANGGAVVPESPAAVVTSVAHDATRDVAPPAAPEVRQDP